MPVPEIILRFSRLPRENQDFSAPVPSSVHYGAQDTETFDFANPLADRDLADLRWYLERYWVWPSGPDYDRAHAVEAALPRWGKALFDAVFGRNASAMRLFADFEHARRASGAGTLVIDATEPRILRLPWELLSDEGGYLFSKQPPVQVRRRLHKTVQMNIRPFTPPLRVLVVVSRPQGAGFIDPRTIAAPLLDALDGLGERVAVEFLRPPTLAALTRRLRDPRRPPVDIVHFDGHGVYDPGVGLGFLLFEDPEQQKDGVDAERLGTLLNESGIPLVVLNACQSAQPDERNPFGSVAARLIESGVGGVVAMNYSVLVETAKRLAGSFYGKLAAGESVGAALDSARFDLLADTRRLKRYHPEHGEETIHLQDWFLPALYQQAAGLTPFPSLTPLPSVGGVGAGPEVRQVLLSGFPPEPIHGFHGRARELLALERLFAKRAILVLHGFGGQGKTVLAAHAAAWFTRTGLFARAVFISFEFGAGLDVALAELGRALVGENFAIHAGDPLETLAQALAETPTLVVWDNFESLLPGGSAPLPPDELQRLLDAAARWFPAPPRARAAVQAPRSALLVTTRDPGLPHPAFAPGRAGRHELEGLLPDDALELVAAVLDDYGLPRPPREPLARLMDFLGRHPLSLQLTLPHLRDHGVDQLIERYAELLPGFKEGEGRQRNQSLEVSLRFSLDRLGAEAAHWLPRLAVFEGRAFEDDLLEITEFDPEVWQQIRPELARTALVSVEQIPGVKYPFLRFHPTLVPYLSRRLSIEDRAGLETRYWQRYYAVAVYLYREDSKSPYFARTLAGLDMPNLRRALVLALQAGAVDEAVEFADSINRFLNYFGRWRERDEVFAMVAPVSGQRSTQAGPLTRAQYSLESQHGERLLQQGRAQEAEGVFRGLLERMGAGEPGSEGAWGFERSTTLQRLGRCLMAQGRPREAEGLYREAIQVAEGLEQTDTVHRQMRVYHTDLADVLAGQGRYPEAEGEYEAGLKLSKAVADDRNQGVILGQLGTLNLVQRNYPEARRRITEALAIFHRMGELQHQAIYLHQLGRVAEEEGDWDEAGRCYQESLSINESIGDQDGAARSVNQLGSVAKNTGRPDEAERWYLRAIEIFEQLENSSELASVYNNLAGLYLSMSAAGDDRLDEAEDYAHKARAIIETLDLSSEPWKTYNILAQIAAKRGDAAAARLWRRKEQETFAAFPGNRAQLAYVEPLIAAIVQSAEGDVELRSQVQGDFPELLKKGYRIVEPVKAIWAGERDWDVLRDGLGAMDALIVKLILERLSDETPTSPSSAPETEAGGQALTLPQLLALVERAAAGEQELGQQLFATLQRLSGDPQAPPELHALGKVLALVLLGERDPDLAALQAASPDLASAVRGLLGRLREG